MSDKLFLRFSASESSSMVKKVLFQSIFCKSSWASITKGDLKLNFLIRNVITKIVVHDSSYLLFKTELVKSVEDSTMKHMVLQTSD